MAHLPFSELPERDGDPAVGDTRAINPEWNQSAAQVGSALGQAVTRMLEVPRRAQKAKQQIRSEVRDRVQVILDHAQPQRLQEEAGRIANELRSRAKENAHIVRNRAERLVRERPLEMVAAAFVAAFILGVSLRIWRSNG